MILSKSALHCHLCLVILDAILDRASMVYNDPSDCLNNSIVWEILKPLVSRNLAHPNESIKTDEVSHETEQSDTSTGEESVELQAALLEGNVIGKLLGDGVAGDEEVIQRYPKDSSGRDLYASKEVCLVGIEVGLQQTPRIVNPFPPYSKSSKHFSNEATRKAKVFAKIQVTSFEGKESSF